MTDFESFVGALRRRAGQRPGHSAVRFCTGADEEELTYGELDRRARAAAHWLTGRVAAGDRVLVSCGPGTGFLRAFLACLYAGAVPVPVPLPGGFGRQETRTTAIAADTGARLVLTDHTGLPAVTRWLDADPGTRPRPDVVDVAEAERSGDAAAWREPAVDAGTLCFLQYTSGSTSDPKGVMVAHGALVHNLGLMRDSHGWHSGMTWCSWLPPYHDMGLIAMMLAPLFLGGTAVLMSATEFLKRPVTWLRLIDRYGAEISCAPDFAYDLCARRLTEEQTAGLDLSRWRYACNGAEPVDAATLDRFARRFAGAGFAARALLPGYGLAESTLYVSGTPVDAPPTVLAADAAALARGELVPGEHGAPVQQLAGSGVVRGLDVRIVDPRTRTELPEGRIGEIWIRGASVALGYWNRPEETERTFGARTADGTGPFLRTGDLGTLRQGELYVTGRIKEMIIVHGRNLYPHDIERELRSLDSAFSDHPTAVFASRARAGGAEEIVAVQEVRGRGRTEAELAALARGARARLAQRLGAKVGAVVLVKPGRILRTTSGKIQRTRMRQLFESGELDILHEETTPELRAARRPWDPHALSRELEERLGDPHDERQVFSYARAAAEDRAEEFPADVCRELDALGVPRHFVPAEHGGDLRTSEQLLQLIRTLARRDFTSALAHAKTYLGCVSVWVAGRPEQARALAERVNAGAVVSLALTEHAHGSDLLAGELRAERTERGWRLDGSKWLINNATRADLVCVLARTRPDGGTRGFSLFLVDKSALLSGGWRPLPHVPTHGVRGADISGLVLDGAEVPADALVGAEGEGLEIILKGFQVTRTLCSAMSLGMTDHALRTAVGFARGHQLYRRPLAELPHAARTLAEAYVDLLAMEAASTVATRSAHTLTGEQSAVSAVTKYLVPTVGDEVIGALRALLGARAMLTADYADGAFQKLERDHRIVGIFDGSTAVNLNSLINQFPVLCRGWRGRFADHDAVAAAARLDAPAPPLDPTRLSLYARTGSSVVQALPQAVTRLAERAPAAVAGRARELVAHAEQLHSDMGAARHTARAVPESAFRAAQRYALVYAGAAAVHLWLENAGTPRAQGPLWDGAAWLDAVLARLLRRLTGAPDLDDTDGAALDALLPVLRAQAEGNLLFSLFPCPLGEPAHPDRTTEEAA
ncbi:AMP-binding protein [Streptomyces sp. NPDC052052]|uniref:AMP-binding protein n=1 Tax=Streptomyces sp. NPDC052052 TaxID=3154756 RepID=UPI00343E7546